MLSRPRYLGRKDGHALGRKLFVNWALASPERFPRTAAGLTGLPWGFQRLDMTLNPLMLQVYSMKTTAL
jgi:hypothetical protein